MELGFGSGMQTVELEKRNVLDVLLPNPVPYHPEGADEIRRALEHPIGTRLLREIVKPGEKIVIVTSDITRPMPTAAVMPLLLDELYVAGAKGEDITLIFALGSHRGHTETEKRKLAGERAYREIRCADSDCTDVVRMGVTRRGTPVDITRIVAEADRLICLGNIEYHYFAGYSGGAKAIMPGVSTREAIQINHRLMVKDGSYAGKLKGNPLREDLEEAASLLRVDFILNVVLDEHKTIIYAAAGDVTQAHRAGCAYLDSLYLKGISSRADIVVVSQGGAPKDLNLYQTQKALDNARHAVRKGGIIVLIGACKEGFGEKVFEDWMLSAPSSHALIERIGKEFVLGGHKAAAIAMVLENAEIYLVSEMDPEIVSRIFLKPFASAQQALNSAFQKLGQDARVIIMPYGGSTLPKVQGEDDMSGSFQIS